MKCNYRECPSFGKSFSHNFNLEPTYLGDMIFINQFPQRTQLFTFKTLLLDHYSKVLSIFLNPLHINSPILFCVDTQFGGYISVTL